MRRVMIVAAAGLLAGCSEEPVANQAAEKPEALQPGEYEVSTTIDSVQSSDQTTPAVSAKAGDAVEPVRACIAADGKVDPALFALAGESCTEVSSYARRGRLNVQYKCTRPGNGDLTTMVDGSFTADGLEAQLTTQTYFSGPGDYRMARSVTGRRVGDCPAGGAPQQ